MCPKQILAKTTSSLRTFYYLYESGPKNPELNDCFKGLMPEGYLQLRRYNTLWNSSSNAITAIRSILCPHTLHFPHIVPNDTPVPNICTKNPLVHRHSVAPSVIGNILLRLPWLDPKCLIEPNNYCYICPPVPYHPIYRTTISPYHSPCNVTHLAALSLHCSLSPTKTTGYGTGYFW